VDPDHDELTYRVFRGPQNGKLDLDSGPSLQGVLATYTPDFGFVGEDEFTVVPNDGLLDGNPILVRINVDPAPPEDGAFDPIGLNLEPEASAGPGRSGLAGQAVTFQGQASDPDGPSDIVQVTWYLDCQVDANGQFVLTGPTIQGTFEPTDIYGVPGLYIVRHEVKDSSGHEARSFTSAEIRDPDAALPPDDSGTGDSGGGGSGDDGSGDAPPSLSLSLSSDLGATIDVGQTETLTATVSGYQGD